MISRIESLSSVRTFASGVLWNAVGRGVPVVIAVVTTPILLHLLGVERWGLFSLALSLAGSFGLLDLGISVALTRSLAERVGTAEEQDAALLIVTSVTALLITSCIGGAIGYAVTPTVIERLLNVPPALQPEAIAVFRLLSLAAPLIVLSAALWGILCAYQRFRAANLITIPITAMYYIGPVIAMLIWGTLVSVIGALIMVRLAQAVIYFVLATQVVPALCRRPRFEPRLLRELLRFGAWVTISNTLGPIITYADRFIVGSLLTLAAVSYYVTPLDLVTRLVMIPVAIGTVLFPAVATSHRAMPERAATLLRTGSLASIALMFPVCLILTGFARGVLTIWLGAEFAEASYIVLIVVAIGIFFTCAAVLPATLLDATGRPEVGAIFLLIQAVVFLPAVIALTLTFGVEGAAIGWTLRAVVNWLGRLYFCGRFYPAVAPLTRNLLWLCTLCTSAFVGCTLINPPYFRLAGMLFAEAGISVVLWAILLTRQEQRQLGTVARGALARAADRVIRRTGGTPLRQQPGSE